MFFSFLFCAQFCFLTSCHSGETLSSSALASPFTSLDVTDAPPSSFYLSVQTDYRKSSLSCVCGAGYLSVRLCVWALDSVTAPSRGRSPETPAPPWPASCAFPTDTPPPPHTPPFPQTSRPPLGRLTQRLQPKQLLIYHMNGSSQGKPPRGGWGGGGFSRAHICRRNKAPAKVARCLTGRKSQRFRPRVRKRGTSRTLQCIQHHK